MIILPKRNSAFTVTPAVAIDQAFSEVISDTTNTSNYTAGTGFTANGGSNNCLVACIYFYQNASPSPAQCVVDYGGSSMTYALGVVSGRGSCMVFYLMDPPTTAGVNLDVTFYQSDGTTLSSQLACAAGLIELSGVDAASPLGESNSAQGDGISGTLNWTFTPAQSNSYALALWAGVANTTPTPATDSTTLDTLSTGTSSSTDASGWIGGTDIDTASSITVGVTDASSSNFSGMYQVFNPA